MRRSPIIAITVVAALALGIGSAAAVFSLADALVFRQLPVDRATELVRFADGERDAFTLATYGRLRSGTAGSPLSVTAMSNVSRRLLDH